MVDLKILTVLAAVFDDGGRAIEIVKDQFGAQEATATGDIAVAAGAGERHRVADVVKSVRALIDQLDGVSTFVDITGSGIACGAVSVKVVTIFNGNIGFLGIAASKGGSRSPTD